MNDLEWLARGVSEWPRYALAVFVQARPRTPIWLAPQEVEEDSPCNYIYREQWQAERQRLGLEPAETHEPTKPSKYHRTIKGVVVDVYDILQAWQVTNPALQHLIKKALQPGNRGHKDLMTDLNDILASAKRAIELEQEQ